MGSRRIQIDWEEVFGEPSSPDRDDGVCFAPPSSSSAARAAASGAEQPPGNPRPRRLFGALRGEVDRRRRAAPRAQADDGARRPLTRAAAKGAVWSGPEDRSAAAEKAYSFDSDDKDTEYIPRKYRVKSSPVARGKKNYGQLPLNKGEKRRQAGQRNAIPVEKMYSSQPCSTASARKQQKVLAADREESDNEKCRQSENFASGHCFTKRRKLQDLPYSKKKVQDVVLLDDDEVNCEESDKQNEPKIYYPSRDDPEAVELTSSDIKCLDPGEYLSSPVINYYIQYIKKTKLFSEDCRDKFYIFNTYFYGKLEEALCQTGDFSKLRRWWKGVNIFNRAYIILPIHGVAHWSLVIICIPAKESTSGPIILHLDSLGIHLSTRILKTVERYLEEEWRHLKQNHSPDASTSETALEDLPRNIHKEKVEVPQQNNEYDCGIFMLYYIERFIRDAPERFTRDKLGMFNRSWFKREDASELRQRIRKLLLEEFESARLDDAISDAAASDGSDVEDSIKGGELEADAPSDSSEMVAEVGLELGDTGKSNEGIKTAALEEESGESGDYVQSIEGIKVGALEDAGGEFEDAGKSNEGLNAAESEEPSGEFRNTGKSIAGINVEESEESGESGEACKSTEAIIAESDEGSVEFGDGGKTKEGIKVAASEEASVELGDAGSTEEVIKVASDDASVESRYTDKSMEGVSKNAALDEAPTSSKRHYEKTACYVLPEAVPFSDGVKSEGPVKVDPGSSTTEKGKAPAVILSTETPQNNKVVTPNPSTPEVVCDSCDSGTDTVIRVIRVYRKPIVPKYKSASYF